MNKEKELVEMVYHYHGKVSDIFKNELGEDLTKYEVVINNYEGDAIGSCDLKNKKIEYHVLNTDHFDKYDRNYLKKLILELSIHELCHVVARRYYLQEDLFGSDHHNLAFGLLCLCVENKIINNAELVYNDYDFSEDMYLYRFITPHSQIIRKTNGIELTKEEKAFNLRRGFNPILSIKEQEELKNSILNFARTTKFRTLKELAENCKKYSKNIRREYNLEFEIV